MTALVVRSPRYGTPAYDLWIEAQFSPEPDRHSKFTRFRMSKPVWAVAAFVAFGIGLFVLPAIVSGVSVSDTSTPSQVEVAPTGNNDEVSTGGTILIEAPH